MGTELYGSDAYAPSEIARRVASVGVAKARLNLLPLVMLGVLAGAFIGLGSMLSVIVKADPSLGFAASQFVGAAAVAVLVYLSRHTSMGSGAVGRAVVRIALAKQDLSWAEAFLRGILCNVLVCMAVWVAMAGRSVVDKGVQLHQDLLGIAR